MSVICIDGLTGGMFIADETELMEKIQEINQVINQKLNQNHMVTWQEFYSELDKAIDKMDIDEEIKIAMKDRGNGLARFDGEVPLHYPKHLKESDKDDLPGVIQCCWTSICGTPVMKINYEPY